MSRAKLVVQPAEDPKPVAYLGTGGVVFIPKHKSEGGGMYNKDGEFRPYSYDHTPQSTWDKYYTPLYAGTKLIIEPVVETKEIVL